MTRKRVTLLFNNVFSTNKQCRYFTSKHSFANAGAKYGTITLTDKK